MVAGDKIPGGATLVFDVELIAIEEGQRAQNVFKQIDSDNDNLLSQDEVGLHSDSSQSNWHTGVVLN